MNLKKQVNLDMDKVANNISSSNILNKESYDTDRNKIKGYKDFL